MSVKKHYPIVDYLGIPALLQLQAQDINVGRQLTAKGRADLIRPTSTPPPSAAGKKGLQVRNGKYNISAKENRTADGIVFSSKLEMMAYCLLRDRGVKFTRQPVYELQAAFVDTDGKKRRAIKYIGDFLIHGPDGNDYLIDTKGFSPALFKLKEKMLVSKFGLKLHCLKTINAVFGFLLENKLVGKKD